MTPELLALLTDSERAAWALCEGATPGPWKACSASNDACQCHLLWSLDGDCVIGKTLTADDATTEGEGVNHLSAVANVRHIANARTSLPLALTTIATLRDHIRKQQEAFIVGLDLAQRTADAEIAELRATLANERGDGVPPSEGWAWDKTCDAWCCGSPATATVERWTPFTGAHAYWTVATNTDLERKHQYPTARDAMKAADAAVKGAT